MPTTTPPDQMATNSPPSPIYPPIMFVPPTNMLTATGFAAPQFIFGCSAGPGEFLDPLWGGANIFVSHDGNAYQQIGTLNKPSIIGTLTTPLPGFSGSGVDNTNTIFVNLSESSGALASVSSNLAASGYSLCIVQDGSGFELLSYTTATLTGGDVYSLTGLYRGLYGTTSRYFGTGSNFMFIGHGANVFETPLLPNFYNITVYIKAQSFNVFNSATEDLSTCVAYPFYVTTPTPVPPLAPKAMQPATYRRLHTGAEFSSPAMLHKLRRLL